MNLFKPKKQTIPTPKSLTLTENDIVRIWEHMKSKTSQPAFKLTVNPERTPTVFDTKIGGIPYWDNTLEIPKSGNGEKLSLLAQLNMNDFQDNDILPQKGILQFFITANDSYGVDFDDLTNQSFFKVIYHENIDTSFTAETVRDKFITANDVNTECYDLPFRGEYALDVEKITAFMGESDYRFMSLMKNTLVELGLQAVKKRKLSVTKSAMINQTALCGKSLNKCPRREFFPETEFSVIRTLHNGIFAAMNNTVTMIFYFCSLIRILIIRK